MRDAPRNASSFVSATGTSNLNDWEEFDGSARVADLAVARSRLSSEIAIAPTQTDVEPPQFLTCPTFAIVPAFG